MNNDKICFITCVNDERLYEECLVYINSLDIPKNFSIETVALRGADSIASAYNKAMRETDSKYKVYLHQDAFIINKNFIYDILEIFKKNTDVGMIGVAGVKDIPVNGIWWDSDKKAGKVYDSHTGKMDIYEFSNFEECFNEVMAIDGLIMITQYDVFWREDKFDGWHFYDLSQSMEFRQNKYKVIVPKQNKPWCMHDSGVANINNGYDEYRIKFVKEYINLDLYRENFYEFDKKKASTILKSNKHVMDCMKEELTEQLRLKNYKDVLDIVSKIAHFSVLRNLVLGNFTYEDSGILDKTHLRFFTLNEITKMFNDSNYIINSITATSMPLSEIDNRFIDTMCKESCKEMRQQYESYQYIVKATKSIDTKRYSSISMINLKYALMRIDNELDVDSNLSYIFDNYNITEPCFVDDIEYLIDTFVINKATLLNRLGVEAFNRGLGDFSINMFMTVLEMDRDDIDSIYNITSVLCELEEFDTAYNLIKNSSEKVQSESDIQEILCFIEGKKYE
ncbi:glycosyl transferase group 2 family protein [Clostridioides difficile]|nr:glycosyl transferase group 2 family protein [Clostridioides difficile]